MMGNRDQTLGIRESYRADMTALDNERFEIEAQLRRVEEALDEIAFIERHYRWATTCDGCDTPRLDEYAAMTALRVRVISDICEEQAAGLRADLAENDRRQEERTALFYRQMDEAAAKSGPEYS